MEDYISSELRRLRAKNREEISKVIESVLKEHGIDFKNPDYYRRVKIIESATLGGKVWQIDGIPVFFESHPKITNDGNKITATIHYRKLNYRNHGR